MFDPILTILGSEPKKLKKSALFLVFSALPQETGHKKQKITGISNMLRTIRFRAASENVEPGAEIGPRCTIGELATKVFSHFFPPDPTLENCKVQKHYRFPRFWNPVYPCVAGGVLLGGKTF